MSSIIDKTKRKLTDLFLLLKIRNLFSYKESTSNNKTIVIYAGIGFMYITYFEILLYHILTKIGYRVIYLIYDSNVKANEVITKENIKNRGSEKFWKSSVAKAKRVLKNAKVEFSYIKVYDDVFQTLKINKPKDINQVFNFEYDDVKFGNIIKGCIYRYYKSLTFEDGVLELALDHLNVALSNYLQTKSIFDENEIHLVLMSHGIYTTWEPVVEYCTKYGHNYICYDRAKTKNHINLNKNQASPDWDFTSAWDRYIDRKLSTKETQKVSEYLNERIFQKGDVYSYNFSGKENSNLLKKRLGIPDSKVVITIFTNLIWDAANVSRDIAFVSPLNCISQTIDRYKNNKEVHILIRSHPAEKVLGTKERYGDLIRKVYKDNLPNNVTIIEPEDNVNSFSVIDISDIGVVNTSTVGLEFAMKGKPILLISETNYRNKGFTYDVSSEGEFFQILENLIINPVLLKDQVTLSWKYFYMMMFLYQKRIPLEYNAGSFQGYTQGSLEKLMQDESVSLIIHSISNIDSVEDFIIWD